MIWYELAVWVLFTLVGIGGFLMGYGWAAFIEEVHDRG